MLVGDGSGGFTPRMVAALPAGTRVLAVVDADQDTHADVIAADRTSFPGADLQVLLGNGAGSFVAQPSIRVASDAATGGGAGRQPRWEDRSRARVDVRELPGHSGAARKRYRRFHRAREPGCAAEGPVSGDGGQVALADFDADGSLISSRAATTRRSSLSRWVTAPAGSASRGRLEHAVQHVRRLDCGGQIQRRSSARRRGWRVDLR